MNSARDTLYATENTQLEPFVFDAKVAQVFSDMIQRSVPGYATTISTIGELARRFAQPDSICYDLGCSLGAATFAMRHAINVPNCSIIAVDNSTAMLARCQANLAADIGDVPVELIEADITELELQPASLVVLNFTLQFIPTEQRLDLLSRIHQALLPGGKLILSEKMIFPDAYLNDLNIELHHRFKQANGYSELEISQKRSALEHRLIPETISAHKQRLADAGFSRADVWQQCFNFVSLIAVK